MKNHASSPKVFIIVLNYNGLATIHDCLSLVFQSNYSNFEVVVVDNDSKDGSLEKARHQFSRAHFIKNSANVGFSQGNNVGIRFALEKFADYVFILNNDALIEKNTITSLVSFSEKDSQVGILSPLIMNADNKSAWFAGGTFHWNKMRTEHLLTPPSQQAYPSQYISGCAMLVKKEVFQKIGLFDERYFLYYEDADFSWRASRAGFKLLVLPSAHITHLEQSNNAGSSKVYWLVLSALIFFFTHASKPQKIWLHFYLCGRKLKNFYHLLFSPSALAKDIRKAYKDYPRSLKVK